VTLDEVRTEFGDLVALMVSDLTDVSKPSDGPRRVRKALDLAHTAAADARSKTIKLADLISNSRSIVQHDPNFARVYLKEKARILEVCSDADPGVLAEAQRVLMDAETHLQ
jgi:(p)ppGpp synthase/HD superfamily hydrolase